MPFQKRGPQPRKPTEYDAMSDEAFLAFLRRGESIHGDVAPAIEYRVNKVQGALYEEACRLFQRLSTSGPIKAME